MQYLVCPGSADDMIWSIVNSKLQVVGATLDGNTAGTAAGACFCLACAAAEASFLSMMPEYSLALRASGRPASLCGLCCMFRRSEARNVSTARSSQSDGATQVSGSHPQMIC